MILRNFVLVKDMRLICLILVFASVQAVGQSLVGKWQVTNQTNCLEKELPDSVKADDTLLSDFANQSSRSPVVMHFTDDGIAKRMIMVSGEKKPAETVEYRFSFDGTNIKLLDKKSKSLVLIYAVETLTRDSLSYSVPGKACEKTTLIRIQ